MEAPIAEGTVSLWAIVIAPIHELAAQIHRDAEWIGATLALSSPRHLAVPATNPGAANSKPARTRSSV